MKTLKTLFILAFLLIIKTAYGQEFKLKESQLQWTGKAAFSSYTLTGTINTLEGRAIVKDTIITELIIVMDMSTLNHENTDLKTHLRGSEFFEVNTYKTAVFKLNQPLKINPGETTLTGNLTVKDITKKLSINVTINSETLTLSFNTIIDRTAFGITFNSPSFFEKLKENAIEDTFILEGQLSFE